MEETDWLSRLLQMVPVSGQIDYRCFLGAPWRLDNGPFETTEIPYHIVLGGAAYLEVPGAAPIKLVPGDILLMPHGDSHILRDESDDKPSPGRETVRAAFTVVENDGAGERLDMLCGRFVLSSAHEKLVRAHLPSRLVVNAAEHSAGTAKPGTGQHLAGLVALMRMESAEENLGGLAMLNALSTAMFALVLRLASESMEAPDGLLALAGNPRLAPALAALFNRPSHPWTLPELATLCNMSRATFIRQFQQRLGRSATDLLTDIRMTVAANELRNSSASTGTIADTIGYQSEAAFQRAFKLHVGLTPAQYRRQHESAA
ncbi:cupin domain-containing protein [Sphingobium yanoikuyae]|jgi:AraC family transcriptional regulator, activator of mtrCDE|uniref:AraC family transcriptional regulator n=1 Tax=Sphingobium yanoikuyae TaxID=13690 RepID=A0A430BN92_SPHYA|nr:AraC family transcriptional regulator [Sphingobium yanoikuyae]RSU54161.1 AraC family transcriptional regulator [Sphingobium yanoikuyae]